MPLTASVAAFRGKHQHRLPMEQQGTFFGPLCLEEGNAHSVIFRAMNCFNLRQIDGNHLGKRKPIFGVQPIRSPLLVFCHTSGPVRFLEEKNRPSDEIHFSGKMHNGIPQCSTRRREGPTYMTSINGKHTQLRTNAAEHRQKVRASNIK